MSRIRCFHEPHCTTNVPFFRTLFFPPPSAAFAITLPQALPNKEPPIRFIIPRFYLENCNKPANGGRKRRAPHNWPLMNASSPSFPRSSSRQRNAGNRNTETPSYRPNERTDRPARSDPTAASRDGRESRSPGIPGSYFRSICRPCRGP